MADAMNSDTAVTVIVILGKGLGTTHFNDEVHCAVLMNHL
jgi:hypothetical protein